MIAGLPMYDLPALQPANDALWAAIARRLVADGMTGVPARLDREREPEALWTRPDLLLAQACGLPLVTTLDGRVRYVATPAYAVEGCSGGSYRSWIVVREDAPLASFADLAGSIAAVNAPHSQSGANALLSLTAELAHGRPFFADVLVTGAHAVSLEAVRRGRAACAAVDCVTWHHLGREVRAGLRVLAGSPKAPALPFITSGHADDAMLGRLRLGLRESLALAPEACRALALVGITTDASAYARIRAMLDHGLRHGCARLATIMRDLA
jgi:ABC-type phosphate/phosphonate transport system substrate-binding protein